MAFGGSAHSITDIWTTMYLFIDDYIPLVKKGKCNISSTLHRSGWPLLYLVLYSEAHVGT